MIFASFCLFYIRNISLKTCLPFLQLHGSEFYQLSRELQRYHLSGFPDTYYIPLIHSSVPFQQFSSFLLLFCEFPEQFLCGQLQQSVLRLVFEINCNILLLKMSSVFNSIDAISNWLKTQKLTPCCRTPKS